MKKLFLGVLFGAVAALAAETFGGIGLAVCAAECGAEVLDVVHGASAERAAIRVGDCLVSANGVSLKGKSLKSLVELLRGKDGELLHLEILRGNVLTKKSVRRETLLARTNADSSGKVEETFLENGRFLDEIALPEYNATVYAVEKSFPDESVQFQPFQMFNRNWISFAWSVPGTLTFRLISAKGENLRTLRFKAVAGKNVFEWDGAPYPPGNYFARVEGNEKILYFKGTLP